MFWIPIRPDLSQQLFPRMFHHPLVSPSRLGSRLGGLLCPVEPWHRTRTQPRASASVPAPWSAPRTPPHRSVSSRVKRVSWRVGGFGRGPRTCGDRCAPRCQMQAGDHSRRWAVAVSLVSLGSRSGFLSPFLSLFSFVSKRFPFASLHFWVKNLTEDVWLYGGVFVGACACMRT
mgnify:CR=1 FL=1